MNISVILATYNRNDILSVTLNSFVELVVPQISWELIVVDNAGNAATKDLVSSFNGKLPVTYLVETKKGKNNALNAAIACAKGELYVFTDDDIIATSEWLTEMWEGAKRWPNHSVFGGRILPHLPAGKEIPIREHFFSQGAYVIADFGIPEGVYSAGKVWGPNMAIRSNIFSSGYSFNTSVGPDGSSAYIMGSETELTKRLEEGGYASIYLPKPLVYHQIREEQLELDWLYGRAFRAGRGAANIQNEVGFPLVFGVPRYLFRQLINNFIQITRAKIACNRYNLFDSTIKLHITRGMIYQYYSKAKAGA